MSLEYETRVLDINVEGTIKKLNELGAKETPELLLRRWVFVIDSEKEDWIRLRDNGDGRITLTYKNKIGDGISETEELEVEVSDFDETAEILSKLGFKEVYYQENKRHLFVLGDIEFSVDSWPQLPVLLEIESVSEERVRGGLAMLGLEDTTSNNSSIKDTYTHYGIDLHSIKRLTF